MLAEDLPVKRVYMIEAAVIADSGLNARNGIDQRLRLLPADQRTHESAGIHRRKIYTGSDQRPKMIVDFVPGGPGGKRSDPLDSTDPAFCVNDLFTD